MNISHEDLPAVLDAIRLAATVHLDTAISMRHIDRTQCGVEMQEHLRLMRIADHLEQATPRNGTVPVFFRGKTSSVPA